MKSIILTLCVALASTCYAQQNKYGFKNLVGTWRNSKGCGLDVVDSNTVYIVHGHQRKLATASLPDFSKNPMSFNLTVNDNAHRLIVKSLLVFVDENVLQWQLFDDETKPANFRYDRSDMIFLKKIEELSN